MLPFVPDGPLFRHGLVSVSLLTLLISYFPFLLGKAFLSLSSFPTDLASSSLGHPSQKINISSHIYRLQRSCGRVMFLHLSVILFTGGCIPACTWTDSPPGRHPPGQTPPPRRRLLQWMVRILLECILVEICPPMAVLNFQLFFSSSCHHV